MNIYNNLILIKGEDKTEQIESCQYVNGKYHIVFKGNPKMWSYNYLNVEWMSKPNKIEFNSVRITHNGLRLFDIKEILEFGQYWRVFFQNGKVSSYLKANLSIEENSLFNKAKRDCFDYFKEVASKVSIKTDEGINILSEQYKKISFISESSVLAMYLQPDKIMLSQNISKILYFPFGCNISQMKAVHNAFSNKISVIEGPPGTGKTQTILNIIANAIINNKTVAVVSNNNAATDNVLEKLGKAGVGFIAASLGKSDNKKEFINCKQMQYPDFTGYQYDSNQLINLKSNTEMLQNELKDMLEKQNRVADLKSKLAALMLEKKHFDEYYSETYDDNLKIRKIANMKAEQVLNLLVQCQLFGEKQKNISLWFKIKSILFYGIFNMSFFKRPIQEVIPVFQNLYYNLKLKELEKEINSIEDSLKRFNFRDKLTQMIDNSVKIFRNSLWEKYKGNINRTFFIEEDLWKNSEQFNNEYPVVLSTTYSLRNSLNKDYMYDYVIVDEASQVDLITGVLTLSCARNVVIVGDLMQLPNVIPENIKNLVKTISDAADINKGYRYENNSLLSSVCKVIPNVPKTLLREHYRCHPKIIEFCNRKFYNNQLIIVTEDHGEADVIKVYKTVAGNHARGHYNQRQIDEIKDIVIPELCNGRKMDDIGIITPYRQQTKAIEDNLADELQVSTVHKFQGREKNDIIISTVDNEITEFTDDPNMLNVAVSRAKSRLRLVVSDNESNQNTNIGDLVRYIQYNNFEVVNGEIYSVFDLLYLDYTKQRNKYLRKYKKISDFDSENLMYALINEIFEEEKLENLGVLVHMPMNMLIRNLQKLSDEECKYAMNCATHLDFVIYNKLDKSPIFVIEVDGYQYHKSGTRQSERDKMKDDILSKYGIPFLRLKTNGSKEKEVLKNKFIDITKRFVRSQ